MTGIRLIVSTTSESETAAEKSLPGRIESCRATLAENGCLQYELFRSVMNPEKVVLLEHWSGPDTFDTHWQSVLDRRRAAPPPPPSGAPPSIEIYHRQAFHNVDGIWLPADGAPHSRLISWP